MGKTLGDLHGHQGGSTATKGGGSGGSSSTGNPTGMYNPKDAPKK